MKLACIGARSLLLASVFAAGSSHAALSDFIEYNYHFHGSALPTLPGRLYVPPVHDPNSSSYDPDHPASPIVLFFHGQGQRGDNNTSQVTNHIENLLAQAKSRKFFIYAPQLSLSYNYWIAGVVDNAIRKLEAAGAEYKIDKSRVHVTGLSLGGGGTWRSLSQYHGGIAAGVSVCGVDPSPAIVFANVKGKPIWQFHAANDTTVYPARSRDRVNNIRQELGLSLLTWPPQYTNGVYFYEYTAEPKIDKQRYTEYQSGGHGIWNTAYGTSELYNWWMGAVPSTPQQPGQSLNLETSSLQLTEKMLIDLGGTQKTADAALQTWNSTTHSYYDTLAAALPFMKTSQGRMTTVSLAVKQAFTGQTGNGSTALFESGIGSDGWQTSGTGLLVLQGLIPNAIYSLEAYGATSSTGRMTRYQTGTQHIDLNASGNTNVTAYFSSVTADAAGRIELSVAPTGTGTYGQINTIELELVSLPVTQASFFSQSFDSLGNDYQSYYDATLTPNLFSDISSEPAGGSWSIDNGWLKLSRSGTSSDGSGITRFSVPAGSAPNVMAYTFKMKAICNTYNELAILDVGNFGVIADYNSSSVSAGVANRLSIRGAGNNQVKFQANTTMSAPFPAGTAEVSISWMLNQSGEPQTYYIDSTPHTVDSACSDLWVNGIKALTNIARNTAFGGTNFGGMRLRSTITLPVTLSFDDFELHSSLPE